MRSTKIVGTIGPASREPAVLEAMIEAGLDVARLNFAHGNPEHHAETTAMVRAAAERVGRQVAVLQDVPGPKLRIGPVAGEVAHLETGSKVVLTGEKVEGGRAAARRLARLLRAARRGRHRLPGRRRDPAAGAGRARGRGHGQGRGGGDRGLPPGDEPART